MVYKDVDKLNSIYLRRKHKIVIKNKKNLNEFFKLNLEKAIKENEFFSSSRYLINVKSCNLLNCVLTINNEIDIEFENGKLINTDLNIEENFIEKLLNLVENEIEIIRKQLNLALTLNENITNLGFYMDIDFVNNIALYDVKEYENFNFFLISQIKKLVDSKINYVPLFPKFPREPIDKDNFYFYYCKWLYFLEHTKDYDVSKIPMSYKIVFEKGEEIQTKPLYKFLFSHFFNNNIKIEILSVGDEKDFYKIMVDIMNSSESFSDDDRSDLSSFFENEKNHLEYIPKTISNKDNLAYIVKFILNRHSNDPPKDIIMSLFDNRSVNDVLKLIYVLCGKSASFCGTMTYFSNGFDYQTRQLLLELLDNCKDRYKNFIRKRSTWEAFFNKISLSNFKKEYPKIVEEINMINKYYEYNKIYLRKRNKIVIYRDEEKDLNEIFKNNIERAIEKDNILSSSGYSIKVKYCNFLNCVLTIDDRDIEYENGIIISTKLIYNELLMENLNQLMKKETEKMREKLEGPLAFNENLSKLGFCLDIEIMKTIAVFDENEMNELGQFLVQNLVSLVGSNISYNPTFSNYITPCMSSESLYYYYCKWFYNLERSENNIYCIDLIPKSYKINEKVIKEIEEKIEINTFNWKTISLGNEKEIYEVITELLNSSQNFSKKDIDDLDNFVKYEKNCFDYIPDVVHNKYNLANITTILCKYNSYDTILKKISSLFNNVNDVLNLILVFSNYHYYPNFEKELIYFNVPFDSQRNDFLMNLLNCCDSTTRIDDFMRYEHLWTKFCKFISPEYYRSKYMNLVDDLLSVTKNTVFNSILLRRRKKLIMEKNINDLDVFYKTIIEEAIPKSDYLPIFDYTIQVKKCHLLYCVLTVNGNDIEYENGKLMSSSKVIEDNDFMKSLNEFMEEQTNIIRDKLNIVLSLNENVHCFGYYLDMEIVKTLVFYHDNKIREFNEFLMKELRKNVANISSVTFSNFLSQHLDSKTFYKTYCKWLYNLERLLNYDDSIIPMSYKSNFSEEERLAVKITNPNLKIITIGDEKEVYQIITNIFNIPEAISNQDDADLKEFIKCEKNHLKYIPETIKNKENLINITKMLLDYHSTDQPLNIIVPLFKNVNDVLRLALVFSDHCASDLGKRKPFKSFKNSERRLLMQLLNNCPNRSEDFIKYKNIWVRFCEKVHPYKFKKIYPDLVDDLLGTYRILGKTKIKELRVEYRFYQILFEINERLTDYINENIKLIKEKEFVSEEDLQIHHDCVYNPEITREHHPIDDVIIRNNEINELLRRPLPFTVEEHEKIFKKFTSIKSMPEEIEKYIYKYLLRLSFSITENINNINNYYAKSWNNPYKRYKLDYYKERINGLKEASDFILNGMIPTLEKEIFNQRINIIQPDILEAKEDVRIFKREHQPFNSKYVELINNNQVDQAAKLLSNKPGIFLRQLDELITKSNGNSTLIIELMEEIAQKASIKVLLGIKGYFQKRSEKWKGRAFLIKGSDGSCKKKKKNRVENKNGNGNGNGNRIGNRIGNRNRNRIGNRNRNRNRNNVRGLEKDEVVKTAIYYTNKSKEPLSEEVCQQITQICDKSLITYFENKPKLNGVYISPELSKFLIPQGLRDANSTMESFTKGTRFELSFKNITEDMKEKIISDLEKTLVDKKEKDEELYSKKKKIEIEILNMNEEKEYSSIQVLKNQIEAINKNLEFLEKDINRIEADLENQRKCPIGSSYNNVRLFITGNESSKFSIEIFNEDFDFKTSVPHYSSINGIRIRRRRSSSISSISSDSSLGFGLFDDNDEIKKRKNKNREFNIYYRSNSFAKFIDINFDEIIEHGGRYIIVNISPGNNNNSKFGWMERRSVNSSEEFEPGSIRQTISLNYKNDACPLILDCKTREFIWIDYNLPFNYYNNYQYYFENPPVIPNGNVGVRRRTGAPQVNHTEKTNDKKEKKVDNVYYHQNINVKQSILFFYLNPLRISIMELIKLHIQARGGNLLENETELQANDTAFVSTMPYVKKENVKYIACDHLDVILSEYMN